jgi:hypothetical protein
VGMIVYHQIVKLVDVTKFVRMKHDIYRACIPTPGAEVMH